MENNNLKIQIPNPCSEKFENFTPTEKGGFCQSCQTEVIDFTNMSKEEIQDYFKDKTKQSICGHFKKSQLSAPPIKQKITSLQPRFKYYGAASAFGFSILSFLTPNNTLAQENKNQTHQIETSEIQKQTEQTKQFTIKGTVSDEVETLLGASVVIKGTSRGTETDFDGKFTINASVGDTLVFSFVGYYDKEVLITGEENPLILNIVLEDGGQLLDGFIITGEASTDQVYQSKPTFFQRVKNIFKRKEK
ncbi:carboxypeptidase-like regulatory domain-containing protein [Aureivirga sp. CE67]|uniref:carboxypeptidase-like regulatory domain-containing protein n=1 Tax=Aureivirga sp. CE67 TaxID=1788983 RepID=UPI001E46778C|nr:carboxypeptidase-like regulatory domain-containing protein [Aureivirga sp. CE67]